MTRIDFYILASDQIVARLEFSCRLAAKAARLGHDVYLHCDNQNDAINLKHMLDCEEEDGFLPNVILDHHNENNADHEVQVIMPPIQIGYGQCLANHHDIMVNVSHSKPTFFAMFDRLSEVVIQEPALLTMSRDSYRFYQNRNYPLHRHDLR